MRHDDIHKSPKQRLEELVKVRMVLGVYSKDGWGYMRLDEANDKFTYTEHRVRRHITNPRPITAEKVFNFVKFAEDEGFRFFPKHPPEMFGLLVNPKTGKLYKEFNFEDWTENGEELHAQMVPAQATEKAPEVSNVLGELFKNYEN